MKIGIVGGGPRGLSMAERLLRNGANEQALELVLFDPVGPGGRVWRLDQPSELLMNSVSQQVTLFTDETLSSGGVISPGPNLYQWSKTNAVDFIEQQNIPMKAEFIKESRELKKDEQCSRCFYGLYQHWFYTQLNEAYPKNLTLVKGLVTEIQKKEQQYLLETDKQVFMVDQLVLATGHWENELTGEEKKLYDHAMKENLFYQPPANPADVPVQSIPSKENVILKGLGLSFFDYVGLFTIGRGGYFEDKGEKLIYHPSGLEPIVYCGSRKGLPYFPRGKNQKQGGAMALPRLITRENLSKLYHSKKLTGTLFFELLKKDTELFYYKKIIEEYQLEISSAVFEQDFLSYKEELWQQKYPELMSYHWSLDFFADPLSSSQDFIPASRQFIAYQINEALKGNCTGAIASTFDALKDWRDPIRQAIEWEIFTVKEYEELLWGWFTRLNAFLTIGPPAIRTRELAALIDAGIFHLVEPPIDIRMSEGCFSVDYKDVTFKSRFLIEARVPKNDLLYTENPALKSLRNNQLIRSYTYQDQKKQYHTNAVDVIRGTNQVVNQKGKIEETVYCIGIPVEGVDWLTAAVSRPYTDPWNLRQIDRIAQHILQSKRI
ncbi:FAD/NAD(P)-binding protein [Enterococcus durans]|uniref:FAD/NAD(P)-binding protein n=1 Tax=Enterococcus durans TaxID=53345 RepID=UPI00356A425B